MELCKTKVVICKRLSGSAMYLLYIAELRVFHLKNSVVLLYTAIRGGNDAVQKLATFFKNIVFEKRRQFLNRR